MYLYDYAWPWGNIVDDNSWIATTAEEVFGSLTLLTNIPYLETNWNEGGILEPEQHVK